MNSNNNITSFLDLNDFNDSVIKNFNTFCMNSLNDIPYHSHKSLKCSYADPTHFRSYPRSFIVYKDNTVTIHSLSIHVFYCESCNHYHALLSAPFLIPHEQASIKKLFYNPSISKSTIICSIRFSFKR